MGTAALFMTAVSLSMDAFAVSLCKGLRMKQRNYGQALVIALFFGVFQGVMPLIGWALGIQFEQYIVSIDHWIAFFLLTLIGGKMIYESIKGDDTSCCDEFNLKELFVLSIATSIDALAVGITFAFLRVDILPASIGICAITFATSFAGVCMGNRFGGALHSKAEIAGGVVLILIGCKILLEHLGII